MKNYCGSPVAAQTSFSVLGLPQCSVGYTLVALACAALSERPMDHPRYVFHSVTRS